MTGGISDEASSFSNQYTGIEYVQKIFDGTIPTPFVAANGITLEEVEHARVVLKMVVQDMHVGGRGVAVGALSVGLLGDAALGNAVHTILPKGKTYTGINLACEFTKAVHAGDTLTATGTIKQDKGRLPLAEAEVRNQNGELVGTAQARIMILDT